MFNPSFAYTIKYSSRRSLSIKINSAGEVNVAVPYRTKESTVVEFLTEREDWIKKHLAKYQNVPKHEYIAGEQFWYLGAQYPLILEPAKSRLDLVNDSFILGQELQANAQAEFTKWYRQQARDLLTARTASWAGVCGLQYKSVKINGAASRWGSCSNVGNLNFSLRLVLAPLAAIDYVVVHELAHTKEHNHSAKFWQLVESILPDYREHERWLKQNGYLLRW